VKTRRLPKVQEPSAAEDIPQPALPRKGSVRTLARRETAVMPTVKTGASSRLTAVKKEKPTLASRESGRNIASGLLEDAMDMDKKTSQRSGSVSGRISQKVSATKVSGSGKSIMEAISARRSSVKIQVWYSNPKTLTLVAGCVILILAVAVGIVAFVPKKTFPPAPSEPKNARKNPSGTPSKPVAGKVSEASSSQAETASSSSDPSLDGIPEEMRGRPGLH